jgi:acyl carrier protein
VAANPSVQLSVEDRVRVLIERVAKVAPGYDANVDIFKELGVKSAAALDLLLSLEEEFGVTISDDAFADARTTAQIVALVNGLKGAA